MSAAIVMFNFQGDDLEVARLPDGDVGVPVRRLAEALGLDPDAQLRRLDRLASEGVRWATTVTVAVVAADGKTRELRLLPRRSVPMWAATVEASRVDMAIRPKVIAYMDDAAEALARAFVDAPAAPTPLALPASTDDRIHAAIAQARNEGEIVLADRLAEAWHPTARPLPRHVQRWTMPEAAHVALMTEWRIAFEDRWATAQQIAGMAFPVQPGPWQRAPAWSFHPDPEGRESLAMALVALLGGFRWRRYTSDDLFRSVKRLLDELREVERDGLRIVRKPGTKKRDPSVFWRVERVAQAAARALPT